jgi:hypothetical protein
VSPGRRRRRREKVGVRWTRTCGLRVDFEKDEGLKCKTTATYLPTYGRIAILSVENIAEVGIATLLLSILVSSTCFARYKIDEADFLRGKRFGTREHMLLVLKYVSNEV